MKLDRTLFSTLYIVCQVRQISMTAFFSHENQSYPPSLSDYGFMRCGTKADLLLCLEDQIIQGPVNRPDVQMIILDGAAIVNMIKPGTSDSFNDYISTIMVYIRSQFSGEVVRVDMVFDIHRKESLKAGTRQKRGKGIRRRVEGKNKFQVIGRSFCVRMITNPSSSVSSVNRLYMKCSQGWLLSHMARMCCPLHHVILKS